MARRARDAAFHGAFRRHFATMVQALLTLSGILPTFSCGQCGLAPTVPAAPATAAHTAGASVTLLPGTASQCLQADAPDRSWRHDGSALMRPLAELAQGAAWHFTHPAVLIPHTLMCCVQLLFSGSLLLWQRCRRRGLEASSRQQPAGVCGSAAPCHDSASSLAGSAAAESEAAAARNDTSSLTAALLPSWAATARTWVTLAAMLPRLVALGLGLALAPPPRQLLPPHSSWYSHATGSHFSYLGYLLLALLAPLPSRLQATALLMQWALLTAAGCLVDARLLGSASADWPTNAASFLVVVVAGWGGALAWERWLWHRFRRRWELAAAAATAGGLAGSSGAQQQAAAVADALAVGSNQARRPVHSREPGSAARQELGAGLAQAAAAECGHSQGAWQILPDAQHHHHQQQEHNPPAPSPRRSHAAPRLELDQLIRAAAAAAARPPAQRSTTLYGHFRRQVYSQGRQQLPPPVRQTVVSIKVPIPQGRSVDAARPAVLAAALRAVHGAATAAGRHALVECAGAFPGCVHVLLHVMLWPPPASPAAATEQEQLAAFEAALAAALREEGLQGEGLQLALLALDALPAAEESQQAAGAAGLGWERLPCGALANPVCIASSGDGMAPQHVRLGLLGQAALQLPGQPRVAVMRQQGPAAAAGDGSWRCQLLDGPQQVWAPAAAGGRRTISLGLPQCSGPALLTLHLLPPAAGEGGSSSPAAAHPLASLPLLCLPEAAAEEALQLFGSMVAEVAAAGGAAAEDESQAARRAYWVHFVPFAYSWGSLMLEEFGGGGSTGAAAGPGPAAAGHLEEQQQQHQHQHQQQQQGAAALQAADLLWFLSGRPMPACLEVAVELVGQLEARWPGISDQVAAALQQRLLGMGGGGSRMAAATEPPAAVVEEAAAAAAPKPEGPAAAQEETAYGVLLRSSLERRSAAASASSKASMLSGGGGLSSCSSVADLPSDSAASLAPGNAGQQPLLPWRAVLHGFPEPSTEAAYLAFKNSRCLSNYDLAGALLGFAVSSIVCVNVMTVQDRSAARRYRCHQRGLLLGVQKQEHGGGCGGRPGRWAGGPAGGSSSGRALQGRVCALRRRQ